MDEKDFNRFLGVVEGHRGGEDFVKMVDEMIDLLNEADMDDYFGTEGWRHR